MLEENYYRLRDKAVEYGFQLRVINNSFVLMHVSNAQVIAPSLDCIEYYLFGYIDGIKKDLTENQQEG